jgi:hypothetical protein
VSTIFSYLGSVKLTITQVAFGLMAGALGLLLAAFELQGSRLHKAQVGLLQAKFGAAMDQQDAKVDAARKAFLDAKAEYEANS